MKRKKKGESSGYSVEGSERILPEEGIHNARMIRFIELGTQETEFGEKFKVSASYELVDTSAVFNEDNGEQNFVVHKKYNRSLHKRSDLGKDIRAIVGKKFPEKGDFEMDSVLDLPCQVEIEHSEDGQYANVKRVLPPPLKGKVSKSENDVVSLYLDENFDEDVFDKLHDKVRETIEKSPEYQEMYPDAKASKKKSKRNEDDDEDEPKSGRRNNKRPAKKARRNRR